MNGLCPALRANESFYDITLTSSYDVNFLYIIIGIGAQFSRSATTDRFLVDVFKGATEERPIAVLECEAEGKVRFNWVFTFSKSLTFCFFTMNFIILIESMIQQIVEDAYICL